ncbi:hypothetical protein CAL7716_104980 (plasmid) [Calothrix sp. PCC 7716]|nr:hypothetical protein CAL7716_104980 [Calothrix sp. PCC 7716]
MDLEQEKFIQEAENENTSPERLRELASTSVALARVVAQNPSTSPDVLQSLQSHADCIVRQNLVMNPNTPPSLLKIIGRQLPRHLFQNPAIDLLLLETPDLLAENISTILCSLVKRSIVPYSVLEYAVNYPSESVKLAVIMNSQTPKRIIDDLAKNQNIRVSEAAQLHISCDNKCENWENIAQKAATNIFKDTSISFEKSISIIAKHIHEFSKDIPQHLKNLVCDTDVAEIKEVELEKLANSKDLKDREKAAKYAKTPTHLLEKLSESTAYSIAWALAGNPNTPGDVLVKLLRRPGNHSNKLGIHIAYNPNVTIDLLEEIINKYKHNKVDEAIANNPKTPAYILEKLATNNRVNNATHKAIVLNSNTPIWVLEKLASEYVKRALKHQNADNSILVGIANNPKTPKKVIRDLLKRFREKNITYSLTSGVDKFGVMNPHVSSSFLETLLLRQTDVCQREAIARHPNLGESFLKKLILEYRNTDSIRYAAAENPNTPKYILEVWGLDILDKSKGGISNIEVLKRIASSLYAPEPILEELVKHDNKDVQKAAAMNPCNDDYILGSWESSYYYRLGELEASLIRETKLLEKWEKTIPASSRLTVLLNPKAPIGILAKISRSLSWLERYAIASNPSTPELIRQRLTKDANRVVRAAAEASLRSNSSLLTSFNE